MNLRRVLPLLALASVLAAVAPAQGGLGRGKGGGGGGGGGSSPSRPSNPPPSNPPRRSDPPKRTDPPPTRSEPRQRDNPRPSNPGRDRNPGTTSSGGVTGPIIPSQTSSGQRPQRVDGLGRNGGSSRSGRVQYGTVNNSTRVGSPIRIGRAPVINGNALPGRVYRTDRVGIVNGYRTGYYHYNRNWRDDNFWFPYYTFNPWGSNCVVSPFYNYAFVPGYIGINRVTVINSYNTPWYWQNGVVYNWNQGYQNGSYFNNDRRSDRAARDAVDDLRDGFEKGEPRLLSRLVGRNGQVAILRDGRYDYSVDVDAFDDLLRDLTMNAQTRNYRIEDSRVYNDSVRIVARHEYVDPWGTPQTMYHHILLTSERESYVIREFGTSPNRYW